jgi:NAD(P)H-hydrate epimerase
MRLADERAIARVGSAELIQRAGYALAVTASRLLGYLSGTRVVVIAGPGHNGDDGRVAAGYLARRGARVTVVPPDLDSVGPASLVIDAAYGIGFRGQFDPPRLAGSPSILACDLPTGIDADSGEVHGAALTADWTLTMGAHKLGLLQGSGPAFSGQIKVAGLGIEPHVSNWLIEDGDLVALVPARDRDSHKWKAAVGLLAGSPGMVGSSRLASRAAYRAGASMVRLASIGVGHASLSDDETVGCALNPGAFAEAALEHFRRCRAVAIGPGIGRQPEDVPELRSLAARVAGPLIIDADGLSQLGPADRLADLVRARLPWPTLLTPHDGEYRALTGVPPTGDRLRSARALVERTGAAVLLKGSSTVVVDPAGPGYFVTSGSPALATAGTGDVLTGMISALAAAGVELPLAGALAAHWHGRAAGLTVGTGMVASDLLDTLGRVAPLAQRDQGD